MKGISLAAEQGEAIAIIGSSGSGKSTFLRCLNLLEVPDGGEICVGEERLIIGEGGKKLDQRQVERIRRRVAMVFQSFNLWTHMTVLGNVIEAPIYVHGRPRAEAIEEAHALLAKVGLTHRVNAYPSQLSGGEQQRAAIARALAAHPGVILFDEPTSALDPELVGEVLSVIQDLAAEGRTMIIVTHEMAFARDVSTRTLYLCQGRIEEEGVSAELFNAPKSPRLEQFLATFRTGRFTTREAARYRARRGSITPAAIPVLKSSSFAHCRAHLSGAASAPDRARPAAEAPHRKRGHEPALQRHDAKGELEGFDIDIARALCAKMAADCEIVAQDLDGIIPALLAKKYDAVVASLNVTEDRQKVVAFTKPYYRSPSVFVARKGTDSKTCRR